MQPLTSAAIPPPFAMARVVPSEPARAAFSAVIIAVAVGACALPLLQLSGGLHLPGGTLSMFNRMEVRFAVLFLGPTVLALFLPLAVAARQRLLRKRALPWLLLAAAGPLAVAMILTPMTMPLFISCGCSIN